MCIYTVSNECQDIRRNQLWDQRSGPTHSYSERSMQIYSTWYLWFKYECCLMNGCYIIDFQKTTSTGRHQIGMGTGTRTTEVTTIANFVQSD